MAIPVGPPPSGPPRPPPQIKIAPVLRSKVQPPPLRTSTLSRQRLIDRLAASTQKRITLIVADAGYGKTTLLADFARRFDGACIWYSLDSTDSDWSTILHHLVAGAREVRPEFGQQTAALLRTEPGITAPKEAAISSFLHELQQFSDGRALVVLDDMHSVDGSGDVRDLLARLLRAAPHTFSFILAARHRSELPLARWASQGEVVELTTDELRFSREETARLFDDSYGHAIDRTMLDELDERVRGWAACLQLFNTLISDLPAGRIKAAIASLSGAVSPVYDYLAQEVMAKVSPELRIFLTRASLPEHVDWPALLALHPDHDERTVETWLAQAETLGLLNRASQSAPTRHFHPLLRDFLLGELKRREPHTRITAMHGAIARATESDPLVACHHYIEAGLLEDAVRCFAASVVHTMGSGRWGAAFHAAERLGETANGAVAAIRARRLLEEGKSEAAAAVLNSVDIASEEANVRAVLRQTLLTLHWRLGSEAELMTTVGDILDDPQTPDLMRDIAQVFLDSSRATSSPAPLIELAARLARMAKSQLAAGYNYYAAISLHNAAICALYAGRTDQATALGLQALEQFDQLGFQPSELYSAHSQLAIVALEQGRPDLAEEHIALSHRSGSEHADVYAEAAYEWTVIGEGGRASRMVSRAEDLDHQQQSDALAKTTISMAKIVATLPHAPARALEAIDRLPPDVGLDLGYSTRRYVLAALGHFLAGDVGQSLEVTAQGLLEARARGNRRGAVRLALVAAMCRADGEALTQSIAEAAEASDLALLEVADALARSLHILPQIPAQLHDSLARWPSRWRPALRRTLELGDDPRAHAAARLLDTYGGAEHVGVLRAFDKTYRRRSGQSGLGRALARRVSPRLFIDDLGRVELAVGHRSIVLARTRRKPAALLMYLVTRPAFTATRDQIIEDLWPESDTTSSSNSLNQSLYFLRREIDSWYEDDMSPEYISYQAELVSLDETLVQAASAEFMTKAREASLRTTSPSDAAALLESYRGQFCPEFQYEEWAIGWRTRVHSVFLDLARDTTVRLANAGDLKGACDVSLKALSVDPAADDLERNLIWLYWQCGARSAAETQHAHLAAQETADGLDPTPLEAIVDAVSLK